MKDLAKMCTDQQQQQQLKQMRSKLKAMQKEISRNAKTIDNNIQNQSTINVDYWFVEKELDAFGAQSESLHGAQSESLQGNKSCFVEKERRGALSAQSKRLGEKSSWIVEDEHDHDAPSERQKMKRKLAAMKKQIKQNEDFIKANQETMQPKKVSFYLLPLLGVARYCEEDKVLGLCSQVKRGSKPKHERVWTEEERKEASARLMKKRAALMRECDARIQMIQQWRDADSGTESDESFHNQPLWVPIQSWADFLSNP